jgi:hypothetical protein
MAKKIGKDKLFELEKLIGIYVQNSSQSNQLVASGMYQDQNYDKIIKRGKEKPNAIYFLMRMSAPSIYFLTSNRSINEKSPQFFESISEKPADLYMHLSETSFSGSKDDILKSLQMSFDIMTK